MRITFAELGDPQVRALIELHQRDMFAISPPGTSFALDVSGLDRADVELFGAWDGDVLVAIGALRRLSADSAEIKAMRTHPDHRGRGAARAILAAIIDRARTQGIRRLSLETGTSAAFTPAIALYTSTGFRPGAAFACYANGPHNQCYHRVLAAEPEAGAADEL